MGDSRHSTRRQFLTGRAAVAALGDLTHGTAGDEASPRPDGSGLAPPHSAASATWLLHFSRRAMACEFQIFLTADHPPQGPEAALAALDEIDRLEDQLSVYRAHSELSRLNRLAASEPVVAEPQLFALLRRAQDLFVETEGAFDITAGPLAKVWGFFQRQGRLPSDDELRAALECVGSQRLLLDAAESSVRFARAGVEINLGAIGKGYAIDRAAACLCQRDVTNFLLHGGTSSVLARGERQSAATADGAWKIGIGHPLRPECRLGQVVLRDQALGTSGSATQSFHHRGERYGHILDPRTGRPAQGVASVSVIADDAATADALSTAFYVLGPERAEAYARRHPEIGALVVLACGPGTNVEVIAMNLAEDRWQPHL